MKIVYYHWASYYDNDIPELLRQKGVLCDLLHWKFEDKNHDDKFLHHIEHNISLETYDLIFSVNYWPLLSEIAQKSKIPYVAWCYDNPLNVRDIEQTLGNSVNHVYCFDRIQAETYQRSGFPVKHLPLGVNVERLSSVSPTCAKCNDYRTDISFIGKLYDSAIDLITAQTDDYCKGYLQSVIASQQELYGAYIIDKVITDDFIQKINTSFRKLHPTSEFRIRKPELIYALACEVTKRDRLILLSLLGTRYKTRFYSYDTSSLIKGVEKYPPIDYFSEMPYIFAASRINLNPSLRAIQTGIPLRALDIMACGGFLLSNYQQELAEFFEYGKEMVLYESYPDAVEKAAFYLTHEDLRNQIAAGGRKKVLQEFDMKDRLAYMLEHL